MEELAVKQAKKDFATDLLDVYPDSEAAERLEMAELFDDDTNFIVKQFHKP